MNHTRRQIDDLGLHPDITADLDTYKSKSLYYEEFLQHQMNASEILTGVALHNEYEVVPFCRFTATRIYLADPGMGKRVMEKPIGFKKKDIQQVIQYGVEQLNHGRIPAEIPYTADDFLEGLYRTEPALGSHYMLFFRDIDAAMDSVYKRVVLTRPFAPLQQVEVKDVSTRTELINIVLPLSGRTEKFQRFMERFVEVCVKVDKRVMLTVVYFGKEGLKDVKLILAKIEELYRYRHVNLVTLDEEFSRGRGLQVGAQSWTGRGAGGADVLMFMCDVDIVFTAEFLERCRLNTARGKRVYYPMVFSLYNPNVVYALHDLVVPPQEEQMVISKDTGFWRDFGFGMTCQYRSDFLAIHGFDEQITGWGMEDVLLYRKYVRSNLMVVRATDPTIFHIWHEKQCDQELPWEQYRGCIRSKALNEASHAQLGMLAFKDEVNIHKNMKHPENTADSAKNEGNGGGRGGGKGGGNGGGNVAGNDGGHGNNVRRTGAKKSSRRG